MTDKKVAGVMEVKGIGGVWRVGRLLHKVSQRKRVAGGFMFDSDFTV
jgi:hypothetical protein